MGRLQGQVGEGVGRTSAVRVGSGSAKWVKGWMQAGFGIWVEGQSAQCHSAHVPVHDRHSARRAELRGVLRALSARRGST